MARDWKNMLYFGDNLPILRQHVANESVDLIYLDPPFNSKATYNVLFKETSGEQSAAQITAFEDTWHWGLESESAYHEVVTSGPKKLADLLQALRAFLGQNDMMAYLTMMAIRLVELHRVLKPTGSIYLHCDPTADHYLKMLMDAIFGLAQFRNEVIWHYKTFHGQVGTYFPKKHDVLLFYTKTPQWTFNRLFNEEYEDTIDYKRWNQYLVRGNEIVGANMPMQDSRFRRFYRRWVREHGREPAPDDVVYVVEGQALDTVWDLKAVDPKDKNRLGYPTQKPEALLERIIEASSNEGDLVLDPFCGCGTAVAVAERLHRRWIGIDITHLAITLIRHRLHDTFGQALAPYKVLGDPKDLMSAEALAVENRYQFEWWALGLVDARPAHDKKKGADTGIDGYIYFFDDDSGKAKSLIVQVKSGKVGVSQIRDLRGVLEAEKAPIGAFITLQEPTRPMIEEAISAGFYESPTYYKEQKFPRMQILTVGELLSGRQLQYPRLGIGTFKKAQRKGKTPIARQQTLLEE